ncbi:glycosyltransferase [candidate division KSB3 bacterium]|uniref:Glycosyltransferase n=1 Tax=candidate division KSB3 bacterium TaxID=2044937 RepID=A0A2G6E2X3_9BACT|nr:MAG: glycosyltransferase [candidate division KSB3 bacterium]PIE28906.1 MAG: glycosyltransferase [candidate division KSB3 bacterium]
MKRISLVFPVYNEEEVLPLLYERVRRTLETLEYEVEVILINDGSQDNSLQLIQTFHEEDPRFKAIDFARNFGHQVAITAGIDFASGDAVLLLDADLQDPPELLPQFLAKWEEGYQVVYAVRKTRQEHIAKRAAYASFYRILQQISNIPIPLDSGDFCLMDRRVIDILKAMPERNRFVRGLRSWTGFRQIGLEYDRETRQAGDVKYTMTRLFKLALDGIFSFSYVPLKIVSYAGFTISLISFLGILIYLHKKLFIGGEPQGFPTLVVLVLFMGGIQLISLGIIGEYIGRIYDEVKQRPIYIVKKIYGDLVKT